MTDSMIFYRSFYEAITKLEPQDKNSVFDAIMEFSLNEKEVQLSGVAEAIFTLIKPQLQANAKRRKNGNKGGRPSKQKKPNNNQDKTKSEPNVNVNDNVNDNVVIEATLLSACEKPEVTLTTKTDFQIIYETGIATFPRLATASTAAIRRWITDGFSTELDILPVIERFATTGKDIGTWDYFSRPIADERKTRETPTPEGRAKGFGHAVRTRESAHDIMGRAWAAAGGIIA